MRKLFLWSGLLLILVGGFLAWRASHPPLNDQEQIAAALADIETQANARSARGITAHMTDDFQFGAMGRKELGQNLGGGFFQYQTVELHTSGVSTQIQNDEAFTKGHYALELSQQAGVTPDTTTGDFKAWWRKEDGVWKIYKAEGTNVPN